MTSHGSIKDDKRARQPAADAPCPATAPKPPRRLAWGSRKGSELIEFGLVFLPLMGFVFLFLDIAWAVFARSMMQNAVREGARYAVTGRVQTGKGQIASIKSVVQANSAGVLSGEKGLNAIKIRFYSPETFADITAVSGANAGGNLVEVSAEGFPWAPLAPVMRNKGPLTFTARSMDRMEASPASGAPAL